MRVYGGSRYEGICPCVEKNSILLYSDEKAGAKYGYKDGWVSGEDEEVGDSELAGAEAPNLIFEYTGAGQRGHQTFLGQTGSRNAAVLRHAEQGRTLRLFIAAGKVKNSNEKLHRYIGTFKLDEQQPYVVRVAPDEDSQQRRVIVFRLQPTGPIAFNPADRIAPAATTQAWLVPADITTAKVVEPERTKNRTGYRSATPATDIERREATLSDLLEAYLTEQGHKVGRVDIRVKGTTSRLITDLYDASTHVLYELKGSAKREAVRMALGQLLDYRRHIELNQHAGRPRIAAVFPTRPSDDLCNLLVEHDVAVVYLDGEAFVGVPLSSPTFMPTGRPS